MTKQECAVIQAYTGVCMLQGDDSKFYYSYIEKLLGRPVLTHEIPSLSNKIKELSFNDFSEICNTSVDLDAMLDDLYEYL